MVCRLLTAIWVLFALAPQSDAATLSGTVRDQQGRPVADATVDVATAAPLVGLGVFCPSCYLDCQKRTSTDADGRYAIDDLSDSLRFRILFAAPGMTTQITKLVDPRSGPVEISLVPMPDVAEEQKIGGVVVNQHGQPVEGALLEAVGAKQGERRWGGAVDLPPVVTGAAGRFSFALPEDLDGIDIEVRADGYAGVKTDLIERGTADRRIVVPRGATVRGRLMHQGAPIAHTPVAVVQTNRNTNNFFIAAVSRRTDGDGEFEISSLPAEQGYVVFSPVGEGANPNGNLIVTTAFEMPKDGEVFDLGELESTKGLSLAGRLVPAAGEGLPARAKIIVGREPAWDLIEIAPDAEGRFSIEGLPPEGYELQIVAEDCQIDGARLEMQQLDSNAIGINLEESKSNVIVPIKRGSLPSPAVNNAHVDVEGGSQVISGVVIDPQGQPVAGVQVSAQLAHSYQPLSFRNGRSKSWAVTDAEGRFEVSDLPDAPIQLIVYHPPRMGGRIVFPAKAWPAMNQRDLRIIYDPALQR